MAKRLQSSGASSLLALSELASWVQSAMLKTSTFMLKKIAYPQPKEGTVGNSQFATGTGGRFRETAAITTVLGFDGLAVDRAGSRQGRDR